MGDYFDGQSNQSDSVLDAETLSTFMADKMGALTTIVDRSDATLIQRCPNLKAVCNIAVGFNNIDLPVCTAVGVMATNTPDVLDDSTARQYKLIKAARLKCHVKT